MSILLCFFAPSIQIVMVLLKLDSHATATQRKVPEYIKCTRARALALTAMFILIHARAPNQASREGTYTVARRGAYM